MDIPWRELEQTTDQSLRLRTLPFAAAPLPPKALLIWIGDRQAVIPADQVLGVGRLNAADWMRVSVRWDQRRLRLVDAKARLRVPGRPGPYYVALRSGEAHAVDGLGGFVDYEPASLRPYSLRAAGSAILGKVRVVGARGGEAELIRL